MMMLLHIFKAMVQFHYALMKANPVGCGVAAGSILWRLHAMIGRGLDEAPKPLPPAMRRVVLWLLSCLVGFAVVLELLKQMIIYWPH